MKVAKKNILITNDRINCFDGRAQPSSFKNSYDYLTDNYLLATES